MRHALVALLLGFLLLSISVIWLGIQDLLNPPFTDNQIADSLVDTWDPEAIVAFAILALLVIGLGLSVFGAYRAGPGRVRHLAIASIVLAFVASGITLQNHAALTQRTTRLTGQSFGGFFGLGLGPL